MEKILVKVNDVRDLPSKLENVFDCMTSRDLDKIANIIEDYDRYCSIVSKLKYSFDNIDNPSELIKLNESDRRTAVDLQRRKVAEDVFNVFRQYFEFVE